MPTRRAVFAFLLVANNTPARAQQRAVDELHGTLNRQNFPAFERFISERLNRVIGLKINAEPSEHATGLSIGAHNGQFVAYSMNAAMSEIVASAGFTWYRGNYVFDGFFIVKSGGMHQGVISYGLEPVAEAAVRLNRGITIRQVNLR